VRKARFSGSGGHRLGVLDRLDQRHRAFRHLAEGADHLGMAGMADEQYVPAGATSRSAWRWTFETSGQVASR
jgi:hypothetical protein